MSGHFKQLIESARVRHARLAVALIGTPQKTIEAAIRVQVLVGAGGSTELPVQSLDDVRSAALACWTERGTFDGLPRSYWRYLGRALLHPERNPAEWLAREPGLLTAYASGLRAMRRIPFVTGLLRTFIQVFPVEDSVLFEATGQIISELLAEVRTPATELWCMRLGDLGLLTPQGPARVAGSVMRPALARKMDLSTELSAVGLGPELASSKFVTAAWKSLLISCKTVVPGLEELRTLLHSLAPENDRLARPDLRVETAEALLAPCARTRPAEDVRLALESFFLKTYGDPATNSSSWQGISADIRSVILGWLALRRVHQFFHILDRTALDRHWRARKEFWTPFLDSGAVVEAWLAFGPTALKMVQLEHDGKRGLGAMLQPGGSVQQNHTVLLMKVRGRRGIATITEWSHQGVCRVWLEGSKTAPALYGSKYSKSELMIRPDHEQIHYETWQLRLRDFLLNEVGVPRP